MTYNRKSHRVTVSADAPAISTADMKSFLRVSGAVDDALIDSYVAAATEAVKEYLKVGLLTETIVFQMDGFTSRNADAALMQFGGGAHTASVPHVLGGGDFFDLPYAPVQSVTSITTYDRDNTAAVFTSSAYSVDLNSGKVFLNEGQTWPVNLRTQSAVSVEYVAGYGSGSIPAPIIEAIRMYAGQMYDGACSGVDAEMARLLAPYRRMDNLAYV